jgi:hypothetical protein
MFDIGDALKKLLGIDTNKRHNIKPPTSTGDHTQKKNSNFFANNPLAILESRRTETIQPQMQTQDQPDITYNPNPNIDIPYSAHTMELAQQGNRYVQNPTSDEFRNVDPGLFGFPADGGGGVNPNNKFRQPQYPNFQSILEELGKRRRY